MRRKRRKRQSKEYENIRAKVLTGHEGSFSDIMGKLNWSISEICEKLKERGGRRGRRGKDASIESVEDKTVVMTIVLSLYQGGLRNKQYFSL
jgi:hypothetical protein